MAGATVKIINVRTAAERETMTDGSGAYQLANLDAGRYRIMVSAPGFAEQTRETELLARQTVRVDAQLPIGAAVETVEVSAVTPVIETDRATIDSSKSGDDINKLALNFRATNNTSPIVVATLTEGVYAPR